MCENCNNTGKILKISLVSRGVYVEELVECECQKEKQEEKKQSEEEEKKQSEEEK